MEKVSILEPVSTDEMLKQVLDSLEPGEVLIGRLDAIDEGGHAIVSLPHMPRYQHQIALATIPVLPQYIGRQVALMFSQGAESKPIIIGFIHSPLRQVLETVLAITNSAIGENLDEVVFSEPLASGVDVSQKSSKNVLYIDGKQLVLEGHDEVVLRCGDASITLSKNGKISIRGKYLLSRATGVNRILGGSVQVN